jgi:hypothetical protein
MNLSNPFETFQKSAFRLEGLPQYIVDEEKDAYAEFIELGTLPSNKDSDWAKIVKSSTKSDKTMQRLRLLSDELTTYEQFELLAYPGITNGEEIRVNSRNRFKHKYEYDFWFFDDKYIAKIHYKPDGTFVKFDLTEASKSEIKMYEYWLEVCGSSELLA